MDSYLTQRGCGRLADIVDEEVREAAITRAEILKKGRGQLDSRLRAEAGI